MKTNKMKLNYHNKNFDNKKKNKTFKLKRDNLFFNA